MTFRRPSAEEVNQHVGALRASYGEGPSGRPIDALRAALRDLTPQHESLARGVARWTAARPKPGQYDSGVRQALDGSDLDGSPPEYVERKRRDAQAALRAAESAAVGKLNELVTEAAKDPAGRFEQGTALDPDHRADVPLLVEQYRGLPRQQQADLIAQGQKALERGDLQAALAVRRAADVLHIASGELDEAVVNADPVRRSAREEIASIEKLVMAWHGDVARRHVNAGMADDVEATGLVSFAHDHGFAKDSEVPYVEQAIGASGQ